MHHVVMSSPTSHGKFWLNHVTLLILGPSCIMQKNFATFMYTFPLPVIYNLLLQIYEWCQYQKRICSTSSEDVFSNYFFSGPKEDQSMEMIGGALKASSTVELDSITLENMKAVYQSEIDEYGILCQTYHQEKEKARRQRRLRGFPPFER